MRSSGLARRWRALLLGAGLGATGCRGSGSGLVACLDSSSCKTNEVCHARAEVCVQTCLSASDCPAWAPRCEAYASRPAPLRICQCESSLGCNEGDVKGTLVCAPTESVCVEK